MHTLSLDLMLVKDFLTLCKPKVVLVMLVTSWVGMFCASPGCFFLKTFLATTLGIGFTGGAAAVINHFVDRHIDAKMSRTCFRPLPSKRILPRQALLFAVLLGSLGLWILFFYVNTLTAMLTLLALGGYAVLYTLFLKRATPQNIVIGGMAGAMPPLLGWSAVSNTIDPHALLLVLIVFTWTPPHFWALAIYRHEDYKKAEIPMLPVTHGIQYTKLYIVLYTLLLFTISLLPFATGMSGLFYLGIASLLGGCFLFQAIRLYRSHSDKIAICTFSFSIIYLLLLFTVLLLDQVLQVREWRIL